LSERADLFGQTVVVIGGSAGIGLETARRAREAGARVIITARNADNVSAAGLELGASIAAFDATDFERLGRFFDELPAEIDHVAVTAARAHGGVDPLLLPLHVARSAAGRLRAGGMLLFVGCTAREASQVALPPLTRALALELAPVRANLIVAGAVEAPEVAALALQLMSNATVSGETFELADAMVSGPAVAAR
jgi:NAD(P)-dependent dehydrogenase (short-subunit alcohol dehydrogenase family)